MSTDLCGTLVIIVFTTMAIAQRFQIPANDDDFERMCLELLRRHWSRPGLEVAAQAQADLTAAYNAFQALPCQFNLTGQDLGGLTLTPGVYCFNTSAQLTGALVLDFQSGTNSRFIFQIGSTLTTASASTVTLANCTQHCGIFWQVGSSATLGTTSKFSGNIMAKDSITITTNVVMCGRALAETGAVTMDSDIIFFMGTLTPPLHGALVNYLTLPEPDAVFIAPASFYLFGFDI